jgi:hypothetical protein
VVPLRFYNLHTTSSHFANTGRNQKFSTSWIYVQFSLSTLPFVWRAGSDQLIKSSVSARIETRTRGSSFHVPQQPATDSTAPALADAIPVVLDCEGAPAVRKNTNLETD